MKKLWFKRKRFGWGWYPSTWEGWLVTGGYLVLVLLIASMAKRTYHAWTILLPVLFLTVILIAVAYYKGETPRWQWGRDKSRGDK